MQTLPIDILEMQARLDGMRAEALEAEDAMRMAQRQIDNERRETFLRQLRAAGHRATMAEARFQRLLWWAGIAIALETTGLLLLLWKVTQ